MAKKKVIRRTRTSKQLSELEKSELVWKVLCTMIMPRKPSWSRGHE